MSAGMMLFNPESSAGMEKMHFPSYFNYELGVFKALGVLVLLLPVPRPLKEWAYAGFAITFISASLAHHFSGDPISNVFTPLVMLLVLGLSRSLYGKMYPTA
jgi:hypothetical protein